MIIYTLVIPVQKFFYQFNDQSKYLSQELQNPTFVSPVAVPGVGSQPVGGAVLLSPTKDLNGVTPQDVSSHVLVHACGEWS